MTLKLGCIADDYTGASDLANTLTRAGLRTVQTIGVPADDLALPEVDAVVVSLKSRSIEAGIAVERSRAAEKWLRGRGAAHVLFKICSTFDSTDKGNIGPVMDALRADSGDSDRAGDAGLPRNRPHRLHGQSVCRRRAAERKPAEGPSAQPDARFQPGAGAGAAEQDQNRPGRSRDAVARGGCGARAACRSRRQGVGAAIIDAVFDRDLETIGAVAVEHKAFGRRLRHRAWAGAGARRRQGGERRRRRFGEAGRRPGGLSRRQLLAGDAWANRERREGHAGASSRSGSGR